MHIFSNYSLNLHFIYYRFIKNQNIFISLIYHLLNYNQFANIAFYKHYQA